MRIRKKKWVRPFLDNENRYLLKESLKGECLKKYPFKRLVLEIGMGMGDFLTTTAGLDTNTLYIGLEKDETCVAKAILKAQELNLNNFLVINDNAQNLVNYFDLEEVDMIYLQFSDPWPKKGHYKRRLTYDTFLKNYMDILKKKGTIFFKTDNTILYTFSLPSMTHFGFKLVEMSLDYHEKEKHYPMTGYEEKFVNEGLPIYYALFMKD